MLRVFSTFSGISAASVAWKDESIGFEFAAYAEIDPFACQVLQTRLGVGRPKYLPKTLSSHKKKQIKSLKTKGIPNFGDISQITDTDLEKLGRVDILEGGSPCQAFSVAGLKGGLADERGNLMLVFCELAERMRKINGLRYVVWENVKGVLSNEKGKAFGSLLGALSGADRGMVPPRCGWRNSGFSSRLEGGRGVSWRVLNSQFFGVPQRRDRIFVVADLADRGGYSGAVLFERKSENRFAKTSATPEQKAESVFGKSPQELANDNVYHPPVIGTLLASGAGMSRPAGIGSELDFVVVQELGDRIVARRLHPIECERLQGFPDNWTDVEFDGKPARDSDRYRTLGNSMATPCMKWIGIGLRDYHLEELEFVEKNKSFG
ncbi:DNA cytosine methyltransferase [Pseudochrobactrum asaccharolyticum]|uniref:DNA cytosine methyltransferase n=1 Tax=Pseudochrobactrum asaccharolyticum TaxID=354351 RepID=UPI004042A60D